MDTLTWPAKPLSISVVRSGWVREKQTTTRATPYCRHNVGEVLELAENVTPAQRTVVDESNEADAGVGTQMAGDRLGQLAGANHDDRNRADGAATEYPEGNDPGQRNGDHRHHTHGDHLAHGQRFETRDLSQCVGNDGVEEPSDDQRMGDVPQVGEHAVGQPPGHSPVQPVEREDSDEHRDDGQVDQVDDRPATGRTVRVAGDRRHQQWAEERGKGQSERVRNQQTPEGVAADTGDGGVAAGNFLIKVEFPG